VVALIVFMGVYPQPFLSRMKPSIDLTLKRVFAVQTTSAPMNYTGSGEAKPDGR
jgi:NADH:ubiquinone oxidoreductase subunit 4 (subunit M)